MRNPWEPFSPALLHARQINSKRYSLVGGIQIFEFSIMSSSERSFELIAGGLTVLVVLWFVCRAIMIDDVLVIPGRKRHNWKSVKIIGRVCNWFSCLFVLQLRIVSRLRIVRSVRYLLWLQLGSCVIAVACARIRTVPKRLTVTSSARTST